MIDLDLMMTELVDKSGGGIASERGRAQVVVFEASEGDALQGDEVRHYDADSACASDDGWACYPGICARVAPVEEGDRVRWHWEIIVTDVAYDVQSHVTAWTRMCLT